MVENNLTITVETDGSTQSFECTAARLDRGIERTIVLEREGGGVSEITGPGIEIVAAADATTTHPDTELAAAEFLSERPGQRFLTAEKAYHVLAPFAPVDVAAPNTGDYGEVSEFIDAVDSISRPAKQAGGITTVHPWVAITTVGEMSGLAVELLGGEKSTATMAGSGFTSDLRHEENLNALAEMIPGFEIECELDTHPDDDAAAGTADEPEDSA